MRKNLEEDLNKNHYSEFLPQGIRHPSVDVKSTTKRERERERERGYLALTPSPNPVLKQVGL